MLNPEIMDELENISENKKLRERERFSNDMKTTCNFTKFSKIHSFGDAITNDLLPMDVKNSNMQKEKAIK